MLDFAPQLVVVHGPNRERSYANRVALEYVGLTLEVDRGVSANYAVEGIASRHAVA